MRSEPGARAQSVHRRAAERMIRHIGRADTATVMLEVILEALPVDEDRQLEWKVWLAFWGRAAADERLRYEQEQRYVGWRGLLDKLVQRARPGDTAADRCAAVDLIAGAIDGLGIQAVLEPASFTDARLRRGGQRDRRISALNDRGLRHLPWS